MKNSRAYLSISHYTEFPTKINWLLTDIPSFTVWHILKINEEISEMIFNLLIMTIEANRDEQMKITKESVLDSVDRQSIHLHPCLPIETISKRLSEVELSIPKLNSSIMKMRKNHTGNWREVELCISMLPVMEVLFHNHRQWALPRVDLIR